MFFGHFYPALLGALKHLQDPRVGPSRPRFDVALEASKGLGWADDTAREIDEIGSMMSQNGNHMI